MAHFKNLAIDEQNKIREVFMAWGTQTQKPSNQNEKFAGLGPGTYAVTLDDVVSGVSDKTGNQYWIIKLATEDGVQFDHFINCVATEYKSEEKIFKSASRQMEALMLFDSIGEHDKLDDWFTHAIDKTYALKGKKIEFTIQKWAFDGKSGVWGEITGYLDTPNSAVQTAKAASASNEASSQGPAFDTSEEVPF